MPVGKPNSQTIASNKYAQKVGYISKSYRLKKDLTEEFAKACQENGESQASVLTRMMKEYIAQKERE